VVFKLGKTVEVGIAGIFGNSLFPSAGRSVRTDVDRDRERSENTERVDSKYAGKLDVLTKCDGEHLYITLHGISDLTAATTTAKIRGCDDVYVRVIAATQVPQDTQLHVRGIGVKGWNGTSEGRGQYENENGLKKLFSRFGKVLHVLTRRTFASMCAVASLHDTEG
jgi:hypothetical protein